MFAWFRWDSLSTKIIVWTFVPTAIILLAVALVALNAYQDVTQDLVFERDRELTRLAANQLIFELGEYAELLMNVTRSANIYEGFPMNQQGALVQAYDRLSVFDGGVVILDADGIVTATLPHRPGLMDQDWSDQAFFQHFNNIEEGGTLDIFFSDILPDPTRSYDEVIGIPLPIIDPRGDVFRGVIFGMFRLDPGSENVFFNIIDGLELGDIGTKYLVDGNGRVIYHSNLENIGEDFIGKDVSNQFVVKQVLQDQEGAVRTENFENQDIVAGYSPVMYTRWGLITEESWATLTADTHGHRKYLYVLLILGVIVPTLLVTVGVKRIMRPIESLMEAAQKVAKGRFGQPIEVSTQDEIGQLAEQFNRMASELQESYQFLEQRVDARTRKLSALYEITSVANESLDLETTLERTFNQVLEMMETHIGSIQLLDDSGEVLHMAIHKGIPDEITDAIENMPPGVGLGYWIIENNQPLLVPDITLDQRVTDSTKTMPPHAYVGVPIRAKKKILGVLSVAKEGHHQFSEDDMAVLVTIADRIGVAIENARLYEAEQRRAEQFRVIGEVGKHITSILALDQLLVQIATLVQGAFDFYHIAIGLIEDDEVVYKVGAGPLWNELGKEFSEDRFKVGREGISGWVAATGEPLLVPDVSKDDRFVSAKFGGDRIQSELAVPIKAKGKVIGVLDAQSNELSHFDESDLMLLQLLADQAGIAIENAQLYEQAEQAAIMEERSRLARDLHDSVTQSLYSVTLFAEAAKRLAGNNDMENTQDYLQQLGDNAQQALKELRLLVYQLRPSTLEHEGLIGALQHRLNTVEERAGVKTELVVNGAADLEESVEEALYRIAQEALNNSLKHSSASSVKVEFCSEDNQIALSVQDNGQGFDPSQASQNGGIGMMSMRERIEKLGGSLHIDSAPGKGTQIQCLLNMT